MRPPMSLRRETRRWFKSVTDRYELQDHHFRLLLLAAQAWDEGAAAGEALAEHGLTYLDRFETPRARPEVAIRRDARIAFARMLRELGIDDAQPPSAPGWAPSRSNAKGK
jgi:phage terminase small subunit